MARTTVGALFCWESSRWRYGLLYSSEKWQLCYAGLLTTVFRRNRRWNGNGRRNCMANRKTTGLFLVVALISVLSACAARERRVVYVTSPPPPPVVESVTVSPGPAFVWLAGYHTWNGSAYVWVPGHWERRPEGRREWVPGHWGHDRHGWYWVPGHWR